MGTICLINSASSELMWQWDSILPPSKLEREKICISKMVYLKKEAWKKFREKIKKYGITEVIGLNPIEVLNNISLQSRLTLLPLSKSEGSPDSSGSLELLALVCELQARSQNFL